MAALSAETFSEALNSVAGVAIPVDVRERYADAVQGYTGFIYEGPFWASRLNKAMAG